MQEKATLFSNMILCCHNLYYTVFSEEHSVLFQNAPGQFPVSLLFQMDADWEAFRQLTDDRPLPIVLSASLSLSWTIVPVPEKNCLHVLGPFFLTDFSAKEIEVKLEKRHFPLSKKHQVSSLLKQLPVISINRMLEYAVMLYYFLYEEKITIDAIRFLGGRTPPSSLEKASSASVTHGTYQAEQEMLRYVREGDLNYQAHMNKMAVIGTVGKLSNGDPLRQAKNSVLVAITLFSRAAIDGGLNPELAFSLTDFYFQSVEASNNFADLADIMHTMEEDFVRRVHDCRHSVAYSPAVRSCIEYLEYHLEEDIDLKKLAASLGYEETYFSRKFKKETGQSPKSFLSELRFERAKYLLQKTDEPIGRISARLRFCSQSHFTEQFKQRYGVTPAQFRRG